MNVEEYISSGILESYVMDELSASERADVEKAALENPEIKSEIDRIEQTLESLAFATAKEPASSVKGQLFDKLSEETPVLPINRNFTFLKYAVAASITIALGSAFMAFSYWSKWQSSEQRLATLLAQNQQFAENYRMVNQELDGLQDAVAIMNNSSFRRVVMNGTANAPQALATIYWNETSQDVFLSIQNLKALSQNQQYQLWAIIDGKPVDAGVFNADTGRLLVQMNAIGSGAAAFAVTIEPLGGSENPSLETMQVIGNVS